MNHHSNSKDRIQLSVIVLFYHGERWIQECIQSLQKQSLQKSRYEIILVDNGGSTPSLSNYGSQPNVKVLHFSKNYGFAGGNNKALAHAKGEFVLLMNQDVIVHYNCLEELMTAAVNNPKMGVISANMLMVSSNTHINRYASPVKTVGHYQLSPFGYAVYVVQEADSEMIPVEFISGNAMCLKKCVLDDVGNYLFDDRLKSYAEDLDLSIRLRNTEWEMYVQPKAVVFHYRDEAFSGNLVYKLRKLIRVSSNRLFVYYKNLSILEFLRRLPALLLGIPLKVARPDGSTNFDYLYFSVAFAFVPYILVHFGFRVFQISKTFQKSSNLK